jgi:hypothetical protein
VRERTCERRRTALEDLVERASREIVPVEGEDGLASLEGPARHYAREM